MKWESGPDYCNFQMNIIVEENLCKKDWEIEKYSKVPGHRNPEIEPAVWKLAGFLHCARETRWLRFGQCPNDLLTDFMLDFRDLMLDFRKTTPLAAIGAIS